MCWHFTKGRGFDATFARACARPARDDEIVRFFKTGRRLQKSLAITYLLTTSSAATSLCTITGQCQQIETGVETGVETIWTQHVEAIMILAFYQYCKADRPLVPERKVVVDGTELNDSA